MAKHYLQVCLEQFPDVSKQRWGRDRAFDLKAIEEKVEDLRKKEVSVGELHERFSDYLNNDEHWWFNQYWLFPDLKDLNAEQTFPFHQLSRENENELEEEKIIQNLLKVFRQIELVSIMLRFICPDSFGILSPPVKHVLDLPHGKNAVETYVNYLRNLRNIRDEYNLHTASRADMALWVLEHKCYGELNLKNGNIKEEFQKDEFMLQLRAKNLVKPLLTLPWIRLAKALEETDVELAALIGCYDLEKRVKAWTRMRGLEGLAKKLADNNKKFPSLYHRIQALSKKGGFSDLDCNELNSLIGTRDKVFHADNFQSGEVKKLIHILLDFERRSQ